MDRSFRIDRLWFMGRPRKFDDDHVVDVAREAFWATGYFGTSIGDVADATGLSKGSLYGAFGDKHQLFVRIFGEYCAGSDAAAAELSAGPDHEALDRARAWLHMAAVSSDTHGCLLAKATAELSGTDPEIAERAERAFTTLLTHLTELVRQAQRAGDVDPTANPDAVAGLLLATHRGIEALGKAGLTASTLTPIAEQAVESICVSRR